MNKPSIHILYEYGPDLRPHGSAYLRLLRPLTHPALREKLQVTAGRTYKGQPVDWVIVDRLWHRNALLAAAQDLVEDAHQVGAKVVYALDDNFLALSAERKDWRPTEEQLRAVRFLLQHAEGVIVTTQTLKEQLASFNRNVVVIPHALDERLLVQHSSPPNSPFGPRRTVIGYMGTHTHDDDLMMVLPALRTVCERHQGEVELQIVGVVGHAETAEALKGLPARFISPQPQEIEYPLFMLWFSSRVRWDIAISPLQDTPFNQCKSDIKFLDYSAIGAASIYSRAPAYESSVRHLETGWLADNRVEAWVDALEELLTNDRLRLQLARNAARYLYSQRVLTRSAQSWYTALENLVNNAQR